MKVCILMDVDTYLSCVCHFYFYQNFWKVSASQYFHFCWWRYKISSGNPSEMNRVLIFRVVGLKIFFYSSAGQEKTWMLMSTGPWTCRYTKAWLSCASDWTTKVRIENMFWATCDKMSEKLMWTKWRQNPCHVDRHLPVILFERTFHSMWQRYSGYQKRNSSMALTYSVCYRVIWHGRLERIASMENEDAVLGDGWGAV